MSKASTIQQTEEENLMLRKNILELTTLFGEALSKQLAINKLSLDIGNIQDKITNVLSTITNNLR